MASEDLAERQQRVIRAFPRQRLRSVSSQEFPPSIAGKVGPIYQLPDDEVKSAPSVLASRLQLKRHRDVDDNCQGSQAAFVDGDAVGSPSGKRTRRPETHVSDATSPPPQATEYVRPNAMLNFLVSPGTSLTKVLLP